MKGLFGKFLDVNLTRGTTQDYTLSEKWMKKYLGGRGIAARIMFEELKGGEDPLGPDNILIFGTGPLQGTGVLGAGRNMVMAKSPKTNSISDSYAGGFFPHELGTSGYDGIIIRGSAESPKLLALVHGEGEIQDAKDLWGKETGDVVEKLEERYEGGKTACIGVAGEKLVKFACIMNDNTRAFGRPGFGAVMGSKKLKAIHVKGGIEKPLHDEEELRRVQTEFMKHLKESSKIDWGKYGTTGGLLGLNERGTLPTKNFREGVFDEAEKISGEVLYDEILTGRDNCTGCPVRCKRVVKTEFGEEEVEGRYGGPEYETLAAFGSLCMNEDLDSIALANQKCNAYGLDTISTGVTIAFAMEASEKGLIEEEVKWGDSEKIIELIDKIALRKGLGDYLAKGIDRVAEEIGADFAVVSKNQEVPMHEPRGKKGLGISYATSPRGGTHLEGFHDDFADVCPEIGVGELSDPRSFEGKPEVVKNFENLQSFIDSTIVCILTLNNSGDNYNVPFIRRMVNATTGLNIDAEEMLKYGERNYNLLKLYAIREGYSQKDDGLPKRLRESLPRGPSAENPIPKDQLKNIMDEYYEVRGWNEKGPTEEKLKELGLDSLKV